MAVIYGHRFHSAYPDDKSLQLAKREWAQALGGVAPERIAVALDKLVMGGDAWPPSLPEFIALCKPGAEDVGAPTVGEAWRIACNARGKPGSLQERYRHPLVLAAVNHQDCDLFSWSQLPEREGLAQFRPVYERLLARAASGHVFSWPSEHEAIENRVRKAVTPGEKARAEYRRRKQVAKARADIRGWKMGVIDNWQRVHGMRAFV